MSPLGKFFAAIKNFYDKFPGVVKLGVNIVAILLLGLIIAVTYGMISKKSYRYTIQE